jgi:DNA-binding NtrC family response regulator
MKESTIIVVGDAAYLQEVRTALPEGSRIVESEFCSGLPNLISDNAARVVILDLDSVPVDNKLLKELKAMNPDLSILTVSGKKHHPELRESISSYILACLSKPIDAEELRFWLKSIAHDKLGIGPSP